MAALAGSAAPGLGSGSILALSAALASDAKLVEPGLDVRPRSATVVYMSMEMWWPTLLPETQDWLIAHNGEALPASVIHEIKQAAGSVTSDAWWVGQNGPTGFHLSDAAIDWIEEVANGETPEARE